MKHDISREWFERFYNTGNRLIRLQLSNGCVHEGRFIGFFRGDTENGEPFIFRWHFLEKNDPLFDYDKTIDAACGFYISQADILSIEPAESNKIKS
jgi:hypothetical protein